jgi:hypothetical protein
MDELLRTPLLETVWKFRIGLDLACSEWPKQGEVVPFRPLEPPNKGDQEPFSFFQTVSTGR